MKKFLHLLLFCAMLPTVWGPTANLFSQSTEPLKYCGSAEAEKKFMNEHPELVPQIEAEREKLEKHTQEFSKFEKAKTAGQVYIIPVVFHILHDFGPENISKEQVLDQMRILNEDFRKLNADTSQTISVFKSIAADSEIEFRLAQKDPNGNCTNGINRVWTNLTYAGSDDAKIVYWPRDKYMNVWVVKKITNPAGAAGYTYKPGNTFASNDGIVIEHSYVGSIGTSSLSKSHTLTHEVGHWLNLNHPWGSNEVGTVCGDDAVSDTPITKGWTSCNLNGSVCNPPIIENVQNHMDYSYCTTMFTEGQKTRMRAALNSSTASRNNLWTTANLNFTGANQTPALCAADFSTYPTIVCEGQPVTFYDESFNGQPDFWQWNFTGATPSISNDTNPTVTYNVAGTYNVTFTAGSSGNTFTKTKNSYITILPASGKPLPYSESFEVAAIPNNDWFISNTDNSIYKWTLVSNTSYSGTKCLKMNNFGNDTIEKDELFSSTINLSGLTSATVKFKVAYCQRNSSTADKLTVYASNNCGQTWSPRFAKSGSTLSTAPIQNTAFTPSDTSKWKEFSFTLPSSYFVSNFRLKFTFEADGGNNLYLDDVNIIGTPTSLQETLISTLPFQIYPNPNDGKFEVRISNHSEFTNCKLQVYNLLGEIVYSKQLERSGNPAQAGRTTINEQLTTNLSPGVYFVKIETEQVSAVKKLIISQK